MIEHYLRCDHCNQKFNADEKGNVKKPKKGMIFISSMELVKSNQDCQGYSHSRNFYGLFFCGIDCFSKFLSNVKD